MAIFSTGFPSKFTGLEFTTSTSSTRASVSQILRYNSQVLWLIRIINCFSIQISYLEWHTYSHTVMRICFQDELEGDSITEECCAYWGFWMFSELGPFSGILKDWEGRKRAKEVTTRIWRDQPEHPHETWEWALNIHLRIQISTWEGLALSHSSKNQI